MLNKNTLKYDVVELLVERMKGKEVAFEGGEYYPILNVEEVYFLNNKEGRTWFLNVLFGKTYMVFSLSMNSPYYEDLRIVYKDRLDCRNLTMDNVKDLLDKAILYFQKAGQDKTKQTEDYLRQNHCITSYK